MDPETVLLSLTKPSESQSFFVVSVPLAKRL